MSWKIGRKFTATCALAVALSIEPATYHISFPASQSNYSIVLIISSAEKTHPYYQYDEVPILSADTVVVDVPRRKLPKGQYNLTAMLMYWPDGTNGPIAVDSAETTIDEP